MIFLEIIFVFLKIGLLGFGGGYAVLALLQHDVVEKYEWLNHSEFADLLVLSQMTPGPININCATYIGYTSVFEVYNSEFLAIIGAVVASISLCLPSLIISFFILKFLISGTKTNAIVNNALLGLRPCVVGLIFSAAIMLMNTSTFSDYKGIIIGVICFLAAFFTKINPIILIVLSGIAGYFFYV